uniref:RED-like N-terminal domain-containing protein n=1 Tax=Panagrolaimus sp. PS1159 TaxID=55785 RepID=A0AC35G9W9_9BILA
MASLKNDDFRKLLTTASKTRSSETSSNQSSNAATNNRRNDKKIPGGKKKFHSKKKDEEEKTDVDKIFDESQQHLTEIMKGYRDRAKERRNADTNKEMDEAALRLMIHGIMPTDLEKNRGELTIEQSKLLGGDLEHTHMVKGLDYALLEKMKTDKEESDEEVDDDKDLPASSLAPEKVAKNPMVRRTLRTLFHTIYPKRNEHFAPGRMAYVCDFENQDNDVPSTLLRSLEETPKENPSVKTDKLILEHLTNILPYLRDKKRQKKKKKPVDDEEEAKALGDIKIFDDAGDYDTRVKPLSKHDKTRSDRDKDEKRSYFNDSKDERRNRRDDGDDRRRESDRYRKRDDDSRSSRRDRSPDRRDREKDRHHRDRTPERSRDKERKDEIRKSSIFDKHPSSSDSRKRSAISPTTNAEAKSTTKKIKQDEAYSEYFTEDMDFVETIASDDDDDEASLAIAKSRMFHEIGTDEKDAKGKKILDRKKPNQSKADVARKFDNELKKIDEIWAKKKDTKMNY